MKASEYAIQLIKSFESVLYSDCGKVGGYVVAKQCATIAVNKIIEMEKRNRGYNNSTKWLEIVIDEINKL